MGRVRQMDLRKVRGEERLVGRIKIHCKLVRHSQTIKYLV